MHLLHILVMCAISSSSKYLKHHITSERRIKMMIIQSRCQFVSSSLEMYRHRVSLLVTDSLSSAILLTLHDCYGRAVTQVTSSCKRTGQDFGNRSVHRLVYLPKLISAVQPVQEAKTACYNWTVFEPVDCLFFSDDDSIY